MLIYGLDFQDSLRLVRLKILSDNIFWVEDFKVLDIPSSPLTVNIALPEPQIKLIDKTLSAFQDQNINIHAVDIETDALVRGLRLLCDIKDNCFAILHITQQRINFSIIENTQKIFYYSEAIHHQNHHDIIHRAFKISDIPYQNCYVIGEHPESSKWGIVPEISHKLKFNSIESEQIFKKENTIWLLACGLSLWNKKSCTNLLPLKENKIFYNKKSLVIIFILLISIFLIYIFPRHQKPPPAKIIESELIKSGTIYQDGQLWEIIKKPDDHVYLSKKR